MPSELFSIRPAWPEFMLYEEGEARQIQFNCRSMDEPPQVMIPLAQRWREHTPEWAHEQRDTIAQRLQRAGCVLVEADADSLAFVSPDGSLCVEERRLQDERGGWGVLRVLVLPQRNVLVELSGYSARGVLRFPRSGLLLLGIASSGDQRWQVHIDAVARTFCLHPEDAARPLALLAPVLESQRVQPLRSALASDSLRARLGTALQVSASLLLAASGGWMALTAENHKDFWIGMFGVVFFGACASLPFLDRKPPLDGPR